MWNARRLCSASFWWCGGNSPLALARAGRRQDGASLPSVLVGVPSLVSLALAAHPRRFWEYAVCHMHLRVRHILRDVGWRVGARHDDKLT